MRLLTICVFYDSKGKLRKFLQRYLLALSTISSHVIVVVNGDISDEAKDFLSRYGIEILQRENKGLDFGAWKDALTNVGFDKIKKDFDEILLTNCSCYGPFYSLDNVFKEMRDRECDFWGLTRYPKIEGKYFFDNKNIPFLEHIQSYFLVFKRELISAPEFENYWHSLKLASSYIEEVAFHENLLTKYFTDLGYKADSFIPLFPFGKLFDNSSILEADKLLMKKKNPLLKRRVFFLDFKQSILNGFSNKPNNILNYIKNNFPEHYKEIIEDLLATQKLSTIIRVGNFTYAIEKDFKKYKNTNKKISVVFYCYYEDLVDFNIEILKRFPINSTILLLSSKEDLLRIYAEKLRENSFAKIFSEKTAQRGRDIGGYFVEGVRGLRDSDFTCFLHDKKTSSAGNYLAGEEFAYHCFENVIASKNFAENLIGIFEQNPELGLLIPPPINTSISPVGNELGNNYDGLKELYKRFSISSPFDDEPVAPYGSMFWVRSKVLLRALGKAPLSHEEFPNEPLANDGTLGHAIERFLGTLIQGEGYVTGYSISSAYLPQYLNNNLQMIRIATKKITNIYGAQAAYCAIERIPQCVDSGDLRIKKKKWYKVNNFLKYHFPWFQKKIASSHFIRKILNL